MRRLRGAEEPLLTLLVKFTGDPELLERAGFRVQARIGSIYTGTLAMNHLEALANVPGVRFIQSSQKAFAYQQGAANASMRGAPFTPAAYTGAGVLVASIDTGADIHHLDFRKADGTTRIKYLLDLSDPGDTDGNGTLDGTGPFGGTLYTEAQINAALAGTGTVNQRDTTGHGTHGLSIAAGDDPTLPGIAPNADLIVVKATRQSGSMAFETADVINALAFVDQKATELARPYVVNLSLGTIVSSHDGRSLEEQAIDTLFGPGRAGKTAVIAAGNSSENRTTRFHHFTAASHTGLGQSHTLTLPAYTATPGRGNDRIFIDVWYRGRDKQKITVTPPGGAPVFAAFGNYVDLSTPQGNVFIVNLGGANAENGDIEAMVVIDDWGNTPPAAGAWTITVTGEDIGDTGEYHAWLADESIVGAAHPYFSSNADNTYLVGKPGGAVHAITVGSYALHDAPSRFRTSWIDVNGTARIDSTATNGQLSDFSSTGRTRDGRIKPELTAPGERVMAAVSRDAWPGIAPSSIYRIHPFSDPEALLKERATNRAFGLLQGTSFAAPVVTGLVARILSQDPTLDAVQIRNILINSATADAFTGTVPNDLWGYGKASLAIGTSTLLPSNLLITTLSLPSTRTAAAYDEVLTASGGKLPYAWSLNSGALPSGMTLSSSGLISGAATTTGNFTFTAQVTDTSVPPQTATKVFTIAVSNTTALAVVTQALPNARVAIAYDAALEATGGTSPYTWSLAGGTLPVGLSIASNGDVTGTTSAHGRYSFTVQVQDGATATALRTVRLKVVRDSADAWDALGSTLTEVEMLAVDPSNANHVLAYTANAFDSELDGVMESNDGGETWNAISINNGFGNEATSVAFGPSGSVPWAATGNILRYGAGSWTDTNADCGNVIDFDAAGNVYVLCWFSKNFLKSTDQGATWTTIGQMCGGNPVFGGGRFGELSVARSDPTRIYATRHAEDGWHTCLSTDGGATWTSTGATAQTYIAIEASRTNALDVIRGRSGVTAIERSLDGGQTWTSIPTPYTYQLLRRAPSDPAVLLAYSGGIGLFRSTNHGQTWTQVPNNAFVIGVRSLAFDPSDAQRFWVGTGSGLFYTADGGTTWARKNRNLLRHSATGIAIGFNKPDDLVLTTTAQDVFLSRTGGRKWTAIDVNEFNLSSPFLSVADPNLYFIRHSFGVRRSTDRGMTWASLPAPCTSCFALWESYPFAADPHGNTVLAASSNGNLYRSTDRGSTWTLVRTASGAFDTITDLAFVYDHPGRVYGVFYLHGLQRSDDGGLTWTNYAAAAGSMRLVPAPSNSNYLYTRYDTSMSDLKFYDPANGSWQNPTTPPPARVAAIAVDWSDHLTVYAGILHPGTAGSMGGLYRSTDGGRNFSRIAGVLDSFSVTGIAVHPNDGNTIYAATAEAGAFKTEDGGATWTALDRYGAVGEVVNVTLKHPSSSLLFAGTDGYGVQVSSDNGGTFAARINGLTNLHVNALAFDPTTTSTMYAGTESGIFKSTDTGNTWTATAQTTGFITDLLTDNDGAGTRRIWGTVKGQGVAYSADGGTTFTIYSSGLSSLDLSSLELQTIQGTRRIWGTTRGGDGVVYSDDDGLTWKSAAGSGLTNRELNDLTIEQGAGTRRIWGTTSNGVYYSDDDALSWTELSLGLPAGVPVTSVSIDRNTNEALVSLFSDREGGVYRGGNINGVWSAFNDGLDELKVLKLTNDLGRVIDPSTRATTFYAATDGDGTYRSELRTTTAAALSITTSQLPSGTVRSAYSATLAATGGLPPYAWSIGEGFLPAGLSLNASTGTISGDPTRAETASFTVQVGDSSAHVAQRALSIVTQLPATTIAFTNDPLSAGVIVKAIHLLELRAAVNNLRARAGLPAATFSDAEITNSIRVRPVHILELRSALDEARRVLGLTPLTYTAGVVIGGAVRAVHIQELRNGTR